MATLTSMSSPKKHSPKSGTTPRKTYRHEAFGDTPSSAPTSPNRRTKSSKTTHREIPRTQMTNFGTYFEDYPPVHHHDDAEDPHDLTYPSNINPRASMVDNLVLSLDQFSNATATTTGPHSSNRKERDGTARRKGRGHTFSSSVSSEGDIREMMALPSFPTSAPRAPRRNSLKHQRHLEKLPSIFAEDEDSVRSRVYDAQRAEAPAKRRPTKQPALEPRSRSSSASSELDLSHLTKFQGRLGPAGIRRSRSFDFGASQREQRHQELQDPVNVTPAPDPVAQNISITPSYTEPSLGRRNSTKSSKSVYGRKPRAGTLGAANGKPKIVELPPPLPIAKSTMNLTYNGAETKSGQNSPHETAFAARPGFFRRVFGSSKNAHLQAEMLGTANVPLARPSQDPGDRHEVELNHPATPPAKSSKLTRRPSADNAANKENFQTVAKKSSTFFRRRKKSTTNVVPAPMPLTLASDVKPDGPIGDTSPVSSLRAFMDPYLADNTVHTAPHTGDSSIQSFHTPPLGPPPVFGPLKSDSARGETIRHVRSVSNEGSIVLQQRSKTATRSTTQKETFLADSSSSEEQPRREQSQYESDSTVFGENTKPVEAVHRSHSASKRDVATPNNPRLKIPERSDSRMSIRDGRNTPGADSLLTVKSNSSRHADPISQHDNKAVLTLDTTHIDATAPATAPASSSSEYRSALSTPALLHPTANPAKGPQFHVSHPSMSLGDIDGDKLKARRIFDNIDEEHDQSIAGAWLGEAGTERERIRKFYMELFDFSHLNILSSLRHLCDRILLKGETQQMDRMIDAFARRWCECNSNHGFKSSDVVHTICYSILLLNTDLHLADIGQKMTRTQFVRNALPPIKTIAQNSGEADVSGTRSPTFANSDKLVEQDMNATLRTARRPTDRMTREDSADTDVFPASGGPLIDSPFSGSDKEWESQIEAVLKGVYNSISQDPLPLFGAQPEVVAPQQNNNFLTLGTNMLRRTPSTLSKAQSDTHRGRFGSETRSMGTRWVQKARSRPRLPSAPGFGSSRTSIDDQSSAWSPSMSSTWSKNSFGRTMASMSVDSFGTEAGNADYQQSIGFANALSQAIIRDDQSDLPVDDAMKQAPLLEDESLELCGAPWAKEGILKHKCHLEGVDKRSKNRNWNDCFAVIEKGYMRLFSFTMTAKSLRIKARNQKTGAVVGGGNWQDNAEEIWKFVLRHAIASALPPPGYSKTRPFVWALSLPTGAVHLFSVGTPDIVKEFVSTANFWSARLSKEPMMGGVSNMEYGWSDQVVSRELLAPESRSTLNANGGSPRPSTQLSMRSSIDHTGGVRPRLPGDRIQIKEWNPPQQSMFPSQLMEIDQLKALQVYVKNVEEDLQKHNELRGPMLVAFSTKHPNSVKALSNWEKKSSYLLREIVKFKTYIDILQSAQSTRERIYKMRREEDESRRAEDDSRALTVDRETEEGWA